MGYGKSVYKAAEDRLAARRLNAEKEADRRRAEIYEKLPRARELEQGIASCGIRAARAVIGGGDAVAEMKKLRDRNLAMQEELRELLISNGYPEDVFEPRYTCAKCSDTGYYEQNGRTLLCPCLRQTMVACACEELNRTAPLDLCTFDNFSLDYYDTAIDRSHGVSPREQMDNILYFCKGYAENFKNDAKSLLFSGGTGLGKTHLSLAIANVVISRGYGVIYTSAPNILRELERNYFGREKDNSLFELLCGCDLLIVDDLGTELIGKFSVSQTYNLFNSRLLAGKPTIISTNLGLRELEDIYSYRFVSRVVGETEKLDFLGSDIRIKKRAENQ